MCRECKVREAKLFSRGSWLCEDCFLYSVERRFRKTVRKYRLVREGDKIALAISGGKDSISMLVLMSKIADEMGIQLAPFHLNLDMGEYSEKAEKISLKVVKSLGLHLEVVRPTEELEVKIRRMGRRSVCSVCGAIKRYSMNKFSREIGANKLATGHTLDDIASIFLLNFLNRNYDYIRKMAPISYGAGKMVTRIRPLYYITEFETKKYLELQNIAYLKEKCPHSEGAKTIELKKVFENLEELVPGSKASFVRSMRRVIGYEPEVAEVLECRICGEPTSSKDRICSVCRMRRPQSRSVSSQSD